MKLYPLILALMPAAAFADYPRGTYWQLQGVTYAVDTVAHYKTGPGTTVTIVDLDGPVKQRVFYSVTDLDDPNVEIRTICGNSDLKSKTTIPDMVAQRADKANIYFTGVNSDLFSATGPIGTTVVNGEIYKTAKPTTAWRAVGVDNDRDLHFGTPTFTFAAKLNGAREFAPNYVNVPRASGEFVLYTHRWGASTGTATDETSVEVGLVPVDGDLQADVATEFRVVTAPVRNGGDMTIPEGGIVLSSNVPNQLDDLAAMKPGDVYSITPSSSITASNVTTNLEALRQMSGGCPLLLYNGEMLNTSAAPNYDSRRPRTAIGVDETGRWMTLLVVDGDSYNSGISAGVTADDLAAMMLAAGCKDALYFDGGGSSTLYTSAFGVLNRPSDGRDRAVSNGWFVTTPDLGDLTVASIAFADPFKHLEIGETYTPTVYGYNAAGLLVDTDVEDFILSCPAELGTVDGSTLTATGKGSHALTATKDGMTASIAVHMPGVSSVDDIKDQGHGVRLMENAIPAGTDVAVTASEAFRVDLYTIAGLAVLSRDIPAGLSSLPTSVLPSGIYLIRCGDSSEKLLIK